MTQKEWETLTDDDEEFFEARIDDKIHYILCGLTSNLFHFKFTQLKFQK